MTTQSYIGGSSVSSTVSSRRDIIVTFSALVAAGLKAEADALASSMSDASLAQAIADVAASLGISVPTDIHIVIGPNGGEEIVIVSGSSGDSTVAIAVGVSLGVALLIALVVGGYFIHVQKISASTHHAKHKTPEEYPVPTEMELDIYSNDAFAPVYDSRGVRDVDIFEEFEGVGLDEKAQIRGVLDPDVELKEQPPPVESFARSRALSTKQEAVLDVDDDMDDMDANMDELNAQGTASDDVVVSVLIDDHPAHSPPKIGGTLII